MACPALSTRTTESCSPSCSTLTRGPPFCSCSTLQTYRSWLALRRPITSRSASTDSSHANEAPAPAAVWPPDGGVGPPGGKRAARRCGGLSPVASGERLFCRPPGKRLAWRASARACARHGLQSAEVLMQLPALDEHRACSCARAGAPRDCVHTRATVALRSQDRDLPPPNCALRHSWSRECVSCPGAGR